MTLKEMLTQSPDQQEADALQARLEQAELQARSDLSRTRFELSRAKRELLAIYLKEPFSLQAVINQKNKIKELEDGLNDGDIVVNEMFPSVA